MARPPLKPEAILAWRAELSCAEIAGHSAAEDWPRGALDETSAIEYAHQRGCVGKVLDVDGATGPKSRQVRIWS
jgi:hypothetical protein